MEIYNNWSKGKRRSFILNIGIPVCGILLSLLMILIGNNSFGCGISIFLIWLLYGLNNFREKVAKGDDFLTKKTVRKIKNTTAEKSKDHKELETHKSPKWIIIGILLILTIGNPSMKDFKEHEGSSEVNRKYEFIIFSIYNDYGDTYIGVLFNFIKIG